VDHCAIIPAPVAKAISSEATIAISRSTGSTGSLIGCPLIRIGKPVSSPRRGGFNATNDPYRMTNVASVNVLKTVACRFSVFQKTAP